MSLEKGLKIDPIKKPDIYMDIDIDKRQAEENKYFSPREYLAKQETQPKEDDLGQRPGPV